MVGRQRVQWRGGIYENDVAPGDVHVLDHAQPGDGAVQAALMPTHGVGAALTTCELPSGATAGSTTTRSLCDLVSFSLNVVVEDKEELTATHRF